jgi:hypothetical protein
MLIITLIGRDLITQDNPPYGHVCREWWLGFISLALIRKPDILLLL